MDLIQGMYGVVYGLVRVSVMSIRGRSVYTRGLCSVHSSLSSCLMLSQSGWEGSSCLPLQGNGSCTGPSQL